LKAIYSPEALAELREGIAWYDQQSEGLGADFYDEILKTVDEICSGPSRFALYEGAVLERPVQRALAKRFPYVVTFKVVDDVVRILSVFHGHRMPGYWELPDRLR
jgi:plasmid stabilization system protein ParE